MNIDIGAILANLAFAAAILWLTDRERKTMLERLAKTEQELKEVTERYLSDLRDWSGIDPKFKTWQNRPPLEGDTKIREYMLTREEREAAVRLINS